MGRRQGITNVSVGHMWIPRGLIRSAGPLIYAIVNPVKLCHKYRLMPPLRPADVITAESALHNFRPSSVALFSVFFFLASRSRGTCPSFCCIFRVPTAAARRYGVYNAHRVLFPFFLSTRAACTSARPKFRITLSLSLSTYSLQSSGQPFHGLNQSHIPEKWLWPCSRYGKQLPAHIIYG